MATLALACYALYLALAFGLRTLVQVRHTGSTGFHGIGGRPGSTEWFAGILFSVAIVVGAAAPVLALAGAIEPLDALDGPAAHVAGGALFAVGLSATLAAQLAMGTSWRIGVDPDERTELVTTGPFSLVRNPIFSAMLPTSLGLVLMVPSWVAITGFAALVVALDVQVRVVEEPYLLRAQGRRYAEYAGRVGRFVPGVGRLGDGPEPTPRPPCTGEGFGRR
jgi:protein-S-isoprenylcysteine O-methyltransferase Ste14